tara:strand:- start:492 stop:788 length:297 start_codon:yes stop_codon:yes gene_type:complete
MINWVKKDGKTISTNESQASVKAAESLGWSRKQLRVVETLLVRDDSTHETQINHLKSKDEVGNYTLKVCGVKLDLRGKIETVKQKAIKVVMEWQRQQR